MWEMVEAGGRTAQTFGVSRLLGQIYTLLYLKNEPLSLDQLVEELQVSKASVSIACRQLHAFGIIRRVGVRGDRRDFYEAVQDFRGLLQNGLLPALEKKLNSARVQIDKCRALLAESEGPESQHLLQRLDEAEERRSKVEELIKNPLLRRML
ncbi:MAG TPA: MarR family transcriptional regulator [Kiritimatiellia bacterium]|nr:MarR family transcriptional regulator [Kiritimatiellia bacterium]HMP34421.1 MarR family transcriptional regulator [Kiritimatiellia bacterium]